MRALYFDRALQYRSDIPKPVPRPGEAIIHTRLTGISNADLEIVRGHKEFRGVLGHEFVGVVERADDAPSLVGQRVVGEIDDYCGQCPTCRRGLFTHCPNRTVLGIDRRDGTMADYFTLPVRLLYPVPTAIPDEWAVFTDPLAAACGITEKVHVRSTDRVVVFGDGKMGMLIAQVMQLAGCDLLVVGRHPGKLAILERRGIPTQTGPAVIEPGADIVVEATGDAEGLISAAELVHSGGTLVLMRIFQGNTALDLNTVLAHKVRIVGSRSGPFPAALRLMERRLVDVEALIHGAFSLEDGLAAFKRASAPGVLKVLLSTD